jgi:hypothetical protein
MFLEYFWNVFGNKIVGRTAAGAAATGMPQHSPNQTMNATAPIKPFFPQSTHSRFMEVRSESIILAAQGLCKGTPVVTPSRRCSQQIGCIS